MTLDPITITAVAAAAIAAKGAVETAGNEAGRASWNGAARLVARIRTRFGGNAEAEAALSAAQAQPHDENAVSGLQFMLSAYMARDAEFLREMRGLVDEITARQGGGPGSVNAAVIKNVTVNHGKVEIQGDWNIN